MPTTRAHDARRRELKPWRNWYKLKAWLQRRAHQLATHPLCARCERKGRITAATVANHVVPHRGDWTLFIAGELESLCKPCHDNAAQGEEAKGYDDTLGSDGMPVDPKHPFNA